MTFIYFFTSFTVGNVWIHEATQTFVRPCDVYRDNEASQGYDIIK